MTAVHALYPSQLLSHHYMITNDHQLMKSSNSCSSSNSRFRSLFQMNNDDERARQKSFDFWPHEQHPLEDGVKELAAAAGFYYTGDDRTIACYRCNFKVSFCNNETNLQQIHNQFSPNCPHLKNLSRKTSNGYSHTVQTEEMKREKGVNDGTGLQISAFRIEGEEEERASSGEKWKFKNCLKQKEKRLQTFTSSCPVNVLKMKVSLAEAGFFYAGRSDVVKCAYCGGEVHMAKIVNDPLEGHAQLYPRCSFAKAELHKRKRMTKMRNSEVTAAAAAEVSPSSSDVSSSSSVAPSTADQRLQRIMLLKKENEELRASMTCIGCRSSPVETLMLPCRHLVNCEQCAEAVEDCPHCGERILGTVKIFMA